MIPVRLRIRNFMCYRDNVPSLHFDGIHLACLSGNNGNGKSALIDAMTWAIWGQARSRSDDDLINTGLKEMEVEFDFTVEKQRYRVIRKRSLPRRRVGAGQTLLEFQIATGDGFKSITGNTIAQTQQKIINTLHMDYNTFINSAFLRQGHADEFTIKRPAERKDVLANILGLSFYDNLEEQARKMAKERETERAQLESTLQDIGAEIEKKTVYEADLEQAQQELSEVEASFKEKESSLSGLRREKGSLESKRAQLDQLEVNIREREKSRDFLDEQIRQHQACIAEYEKLIARRTDIEMGFTRLTETRRINDDFNQKLVILNRLENRKSQLDKVIDKAQAALTTEHTLIQSKISELGARTQKLPQLKIQSQQLQSQLSRLADEEALLQNRKQLRQETQTQVNQLESEKSGLERELNEISEKLHLLSSQTEAKCPLCESELEREGLKLIESKYTTERQGKSNSLQSIQEGLAGSKKQLNLLENEIAQMEAQLTKEKVSAQSKAGILKREMAEAEEAEKQLAEKRSGLAEIELRLAKKDFTAVEQEALREIEIELAKLDYNSGQHEQTQQQLVSLENYENPWRKLEEAERLINREKESAAKAVTASQELRDSLETDNQKKRELSLELERLPRLNDDINRAEKEQQELAAQQKQAQEVLWSIKTKLQHCEEMEIRKKERDKLLAQVSKEENIYRELAQAFGKRGVQALLIERALPEIESEANRLLGRMTENRMHLKFETQRETKKGDVVETMDINISDELGTRNYEMFSGGEAFRINFAIRIALSKLLARRAGAPLPTLIIDEGFGTQDNTGIEKLKEAINSIQDDFDKIIVITHIEELRDAFPTRIDVSKNAEGSTLSIN